MPTKIKQKKSEATYSKDGGGELLEGGGGDVELGLLNHHAHLIVLIARLFALVLGARARAAPVVEDGDLQEQSSIHT